MSWAWRKRGRAQATVVIGHGVWAVHDGAGAAGWTAGTSTGWTDAVGQAGLALQPLERRDVQVWLTATLAPALWLVPPQGLRDDAEWRTWVSAMAAARHPMRQEQGDDAFIVWVDANGPRPALASAWPRVCKEALQGGWGRHLLVSVRPLWSHAFGRRELARPGAATARWSAFDGEALTSVDLQDGSVTGASCTPGLADVAQALALHQRRLATSPCDEALFLEMSPGGAPERDRFSGPVWLEVAA